VNVVGSAAPVLGQERAPGRSGWPRTLQHHADEDRDDDVQQRTCKLELSSEVTGGGEGHATLGCHGVFAGFKDMAQLGVI
jgi:hypothetical protein